MPMTSILVLVLASAQAEAVPSIHQYIPADSLACVRLNFRNAGLEPALLKRLSEAAGFEFENLSDVTQAIGPSGQNDVVTVFRFAKPLDDEAYQAWAKKNRMQEKTLPDGRVCFAVVSDHMMLVDSRILVHAESEKRLLEALDGENTCPESIRGLLTKTSDEILVQARVIAVSNEVAEKILKWPGRPAVGPMIHPWLTSIRQADLTVTKGPDAQLRFKVVCIDQASVQRITAQMEALLKLARQIIESPPDSRTVLPAEISQEDCVRKSLAGASVTVDAETIVFSIVARGDWKSAFQRRQKAAAEANPPAE